MMDDEDDEDFKYVKNIADDILCICNKKNAGSCISALLMAFSTVITEICVNGESNGESIEVDYIIPKVKSSIDQMYPVIKKRVKGLREMNRNT